MRILERFKMKNLYYQSHECQGYRARVTIEWEIPDDHPKERLILAEPVADEILNYAGPRMKEIVAKMRRVE